jgi:hypothetical protein
MTAEWDWSGYPQGIPNGGNKVRAYEDETTKTTPTPSFRDDETNRSGYGSMMRQGEGPWLTRQL